MSALQATLGTPAFEKHLIARKQKKSTRKKLLVATLTLTAMVDMFSVLVIFLLQTFSVSPETLITKGVQLPSAKTGQQLADAPVLAIAMDGIFLDQKKIGSSEEVLRQPELLLTGLGEIKSRWAKNHPQEPFPGEVHLQADRAIASSLVSKIMGILPSGNVHSIRLAVMAGN